MFDRSRISRVLRAFGRLLRRLTIGLGALILLVYFFGGGSYLIGPIPPVRNGQNRASRMPGATSPRLPSMAASSGSSTGNISSACIRRRKWTPSLSSASSQESVPRCIGKATIACKPISATSAPYRRRLITSDRSMSLSLSAAPTLRSIEAVPPLIGDAAWPASAVAMNSAWREWRAKSQVSR